MILFSRKMAQYLCPYCIRNGSFQYIMTHIKLKHWARRSTRGLHICAYLEFMFTNDNIRAMSAHEKTCYWRKHEDMNKKGFLMSKNHKRPGWPKDRIFDVIFENVTSGKRYICTNLNSSYGQQHCIILAKQLDIPDSSLVLAINVRRENTPGITIHNMGEELLYTADVKSGQAVDKIEFMTVKNSNVGLCLSRTEERLIECRKIKFYVYMSEDIEFNGKFKKIHPSTGALKSSLIFSEAANNTKIDTGKIPFIRKHYWMDERLLCATTTKQSTAPTSTSVTSIAPPMQKPYRGLKNLGNSCYLNSVVQALFFIPT